MPITDFESLGLSQGLLQAVRELGFSQPTPIQALAIPPLLQGRDLIGQSRTGSGKTAAFAIPCLEKVSTEKRELQLLVLCPTRELCTQVAGDIRKLGRFRKNLQVLGIFGGHPIWTQKRSLEHGAHVIVGTPGRLMDHIERKTIDLSFVRYVVLDEADRMLDMGFREKIESILATTAKSRQTILFSATFPPTIQGLSKRFQKDPEFIRVEEEGKAAPDIEQLGYVVRAEDRFPALLSVLYERRPESAIVFCNTKVAADELARELGKAGISAEAIHGDLEQWDRDRVMAKFRNHSILLLVATDVAARGLDISGLDAVINYELPAYEENYVHRIGRTGRAGKKGLAISFRTEKEAYKLQKIETYLGTTICELAPPSLKRGSTAYAASVETLYIGAGRKEKIRPTDILGALTGEAGGLKGEYVGKIEILDRGSYVAISRGHSRIALQRLRNGTIKGRRFQVELVR